jgi:hypothetical protein
MSFAGELSKQVKVSLKEYLKVVEKIPNCCSKALKGQNKILKTQKIKVISEEIKDLRRNGN